MKVLYPELAREKRWIERAIALFLEVAAAVLRGVVNSELVAGLHDLGVDAVGLSGVDGGLLAGKIFD